MRHPAAHRAQLAFSLPPPSGSPHPRVRWGRLHTSRGRCDCGELQPSAQSCQASPLCHPVRAGHTPQQTWPDLLRGTQDMKSTFPHHGRPLHSCNLAGSLRDGTPVHLLQPLGSLPYWEPIAVRLPMSFPSGRTPRALAFEGGQDHRGPEGPVALELDAPSWVKWIYHAALIGRALYRMHAPSRRRAQFPDGRFVPQPDSQHDSSHRKDRNGC
jgi:hypothetical protein